ncbi:MAG: GNAT family N-acetyltransferase [Anaerolineales bacterium]|nr:GNAT family N-acetyltransferase [Anaerolineales bacterium]
MITRILLWLLAAVELMLGAFGLSVAGILLFSHAGGMNLIFLPVAALFSLFLVAGIAILVHRPWSYYSAHCADPAARAAARSLPWPVGWNRRRCDGRDNRGNRGGAHSALLPAISAALFSNWAEGKDPKAMTALLHEPTYVGDLGNGLIRRWSTSADQPKIAQLMGTVYRRDPAKPFNPRQADMARVMMNGKFPYMGPGDVAIVEDTSKPDCPVVAYTCLWRHQWTYGGIPFAVGQPEMVATDSEYRNRGLIRSLFEMVHARSAAEGQPVQVITGIAYFYRKFGYEYVFDLDGYRTIPAAAVRLHPGVLDDPAPYERGYCRRHRRLLLAGFKTLGS